MMNRLILLLIYILFLGNCKGQPEKQLSKNATPTCNRTVYGTPKYIESLPSYICIPPGFIIDDYVRISDLDRDGQADFIAVKYNKKEDDQIDGDSTYWNFYTRAKKDSIYSFKMTLSNIVPPYIKDISYEYLLAHPTAANLFENYPGRLSHRLSFQLNYDTIRLSYKFDDSYGKTFVFVKDQNNWYLENVEYFLGELPMYWWRDSDFYYYLNDRLKVIESRKPKNRISINQFDLKIAFKYREDEQTHMSDWHIDRIDETKWTSIEEVKFDKCTTMDIPDDWVY